VAPAGLPKELLYRLNTELRAIVSEPRFVEELASKGMVPLVTAPPPELQAYVKSEIVRWAEVVKQAGGAGHAGIGFMIRCEERLRQALFSPRSVALIGQSNDPGKTTGRPLKFLRQARYAGRVYPINARRQEVLGERAWPSVDALPEIPEHAYVVTPIDRVMEALEACGRAGVTVATVLTDGFAEVGEAGRARETQLQEIVAATGMR